MADITEVKCTLPASPINIGDYDNEGVTAAGLRIAVSNNRINASEVSMKFITFDSVCQECNTTTGCKLKRDACFILGHCFAQNQSNPRDWCEQCLPEISSTSWMRRQCKYMGKKKEEGRNEGRKGGREGGRDEGRKEGRKEGREEGREDRWAGWMAM